MAKLLVVDDLPFNIEILKEELRLLGHEVTSASDGLDALERVAESRPDLILLDVAMPQMDGLEVLKRLREDPQYADLPIILLTGRQDYDDRIEGFDAGADDYITKPFRLREVVARVNAMLRIQDLQRQALDREKLLSQIEGMGQTLVTMAHYINNSTQAISGMAQLCQTAPDNLPQHQQLAEIAFTQATKISAVIDSIQTMIDRMEVQTADYAGDPDRMLDIEEQLQKKLAELESDADV
ncbi:MAG: response regulator [bacterium]|nr:response regulator [bacterium]